MSSLLSNSISIAGTRINERELELRDIIEEGTSLVLVSVDTIDDVVVAAAFIVIVIIIIIIISIIIIIIIIIVVVVVVVVVVDFTFQLKKRVNNSGENRKVLPIQKSTIA